MSVNMFLPNAQSQAEAIQAMCQSHIEGFEAVKRSIVQFIATSELKGVTYDSAKKYFSETYLPLANGMILAAEALQRAAKQFPQKYISEVDSNSLQEAKLRMQMQRLEQLAQFAENMDDMAKSTPLSPLFEKLAGSYRQQKQKIHEKLEKLMIFNGTSLLIFIEAEQLFASVEAGLKEISGGKGFHASTKSFSTMGMKLGWAAPIEKAQKAKDKRLEKEALKQHETMPVPNVPAGMNRGFETNPDGTLDIQGTMELAEANRQLVMEGNTGDIIDLIDPTQDALRFFTGKDPLTDNKLSKTERGMALLFIFPFAKVGKGFKFAFHGVEDVERLGKFGKISTTKRINKVEIEVSVVERTAQIPKKGGETVVGHALQKHAGRNPNIWGKVKGNSNQINQTALKHLNEVLSAPGTFKIVKTKNGISFLEKRLSDGRGVRLNMDNTFKGFVD
ncbi:pre-toxin TG domain-containing protein [Listeria grayi]|uniref:pre-toxin TG domain-containing protein n=1 Tax=Listeria grayi TaxID=1641 RepID=UPI001625FB36|nr:pre-toxin TG domain-containing protein [Listeria grayi]MBC1922900.1 hypothetical protein [Listeria grayi]